MLFLVSSSPLHQKKIKQFRESLLSPSICLLLRRVCRNRAGIPVSTGTKVLRPSEVALPPGTATHTVEVLCAVGPCGRPFANDGPLVGGADVVADTAGGTDVGVDVAGELTRAKDLVGVRVEDHIVEAGSHEAVP